MKISQYLTGKGYEQDLIKIALDDLGKTSEDDE
jgi:regulatory protein